MPDKNSDELKRAIAHHQAARFTEAESIYRQILSRDGKHADALHHLGVLCQQTGRGAMAVDMLRKAIELRPAAPVYRYDLGTALSEQGKFDQAINAFNEAIRLKPQFPNAFNNLGNALKEDGRLPEAIAAYEKAIALDPQLAEAHNGLGNAHKALGQLEPAARAYQTARNLRPNLAAAHINLGAMLLDLGQPEAALEALRTGVQLKPDAAEAHSNLGFALKDLGRIDAAIDAYTTAIRLKPDFDVAHGSLLYTLHLRNGIDPAAIFQEHRKWNQVHAESLKSEIRKHKNDRSPERRLRVGYVSADFREHSVVRFIEGLLEHHDPKQVEVYCYADVPRPDAVTARLKKLAAVWRDIANLPDREVAEIIRKDQIDILVDLTGHTSRSRLLTFARKPAPVQVTYLGYPDTTGLSTMDYRLTDALADPPGASDALHSEKLVRLPDCFLCFHEPESSPEIGPLPSPKAGHLTFGSFSALFKINEFTAQLWSEVLTKIPTARLLLKNRGLSQPSVRQRIVELFAANGIAPERLELLDSIPDRRSHLDCYNRVDVALDTFPYHGATTTREALWMGVPTVTLAGPAHVSRVGVSILSAMGMKAMAALTPQGFVETAVELANDPVSLVLMRGSARERMKKSPLMDQERFAKNIEAVYREMWRQWCGSGDRGTEK